MATDTKKVPRLTKQLSLLQQFTHNAYKQPADTNTSKHTPVLTAVREINHLQAIQLTDAKSSSIDSEHIHDYHLSDTNDHEANKGNVTTSTASKPNHSEVMTTSMDFDVVGSNINNEDTSRVYIIFYYILRLFSVITTLFLAIMATNYAIGQVLDLSAIDLFCEDFDEKTLRDYNLKHNHTKGDGFGSNCGKIHRPEIDDDKVKDGDPYESVTDFHLENVFGCIAFSMLALCLTAVGFYHLYTCFHDAFYHFIRKEAQKNPRLLKANATSNKNTVRQSQNKMLLRYQELNIWRLKHIYPDSKMKIISMMFSEITEIITQCWALLIYGGVQSVSFTFVIATEPHFVQRFAIIIGTNSILTGLLWILYIIKVKRIKAVFHGTEFQAIVFVADMIFDFAYTIFPFTLYSDSSSLLFNFKALATLHAENGILFFAAFIAMALLLKKCYNILCSFDPVYIVNNAQQMNKYKIEFVPYLQTVSNEDCEDYQIWKSQQRTRRLCIGSMGLLFVLFGITLIVVVSEYLNNAHEICSNPSANTLTQHPELYYWKTDCKSKLTPFDTSDTPCDCRVFQIWFNTSHVEKYNFTKQHIISIMSNFKMMHYLELNYEQPLILHIDHIETDKQIDLFYVNLTADCFASKSLRNLELFRIFLIDLDWKSLSSLKLLQVLRIVAARYQNPVDWYAIGQLKELKLLRLRESTNYLNGEITESICRLTSLRDLDLQTNFITKIPDCIAKLKELYDVKLNGLISLNYITPQLFQLPHIISIVGYYSGLNASSIPNEWSESLQSVFLQESPLCEQTDIMTQAQLAFMNQFEPCYEPCELENKLHLSQATCTGYEWGDGICELDCCNYDGGDCHQTCDCSRDLWFNDECDLECNHTLCAYDFGSCLAQISSNVTECVIGSGCNDEWIDDGWCDLNCAVLDNDECDDFLDCDAQFQCDQSSGCSTAYLYIIHTLAAQNDPKELIDEDEACGVFWDFIRVGFKDENCSEAFKIVDVNQDGYASFWEALQMTHSFFGLTQEKMYQVDCSLCLDDPSLYY